MNQAYEIPRQFVELVNMIAGGTTNRHFSTAIAWLTKLSDPREKETSHVE